MELRPEIFMDTMVELLGVSSGTPRGGPAWLISYFTYLFGGIPGFPLLFFEVVEVARVDGTLLVEVPGLAIIFVNDGEVFGINI
jgi:hypothetical protein